MSSGMMLDNIIMNIFTQSTKKSTITHQKHFFSYSSMMQFHFTKYICRTLHGKTNSDTKRTLCSHHYIEIEKLRKYLSGILYIENIKSYLEKKMDEFVNDKSNFNNTHVLKSKILPVFNIPE